MCEARLDNYSLSAGEVFQSMFVSKYALDHFKKAGEEGNLCGRIVHVLVGLLEIIPIFGFIVSLLETAFVHLFSCQGNNQGPLGIRHWQEMRPEEWPVTVNEWPVLSFVVSAIEDVTRQTSSRCMSMERLVRTVDDDTILSKLKLYQSSERRHSELYRYIRHRDDFVGPFDVVQLKARMDYNNGWHPVDTEQQKQFYIHYAVPINVGGSPCGNDADYRTAAFDFESYSQNGRLDENRYIQDMGHLFYNILSAQRQSGSTNVVWGAFGMEKELLQLELFDSRFRDRQEALRLREKLANEFIRQFSKQEFSQLKLHLCLQGIEQTLGSEARESYSVEENLQAFWNAFQRASSSVRSRITVEMNGDAPHVAQTLANQLDNSEFVSLCNPTNRRIIGSQWEMTGMTSVMRTTGPNSVAFGSPWHHPNMTCDALPDFMLHRRCYEAARAVLFLNCGRDLNRVVSRNDELADTVRECGGQVIPFIMRNAHL